MSKDPDPPHGTRTRTDEPQFYRLLAAVANFCSRPLVEAVILQERRLPFYQHRRTGLALLSLPTDLSGTTESDWMLSGDWPELHHAWERLIAEFKSRVEMEELWIDGVQVSPVAFTDRAPIPNAWAGMMTFDFSENTIRTDHAKFTGIRVWRSRPSPQGQVATIPSDAASRFTVDVNGLVILRPEDVGGLSHGTIAALLEEHARRVVEETGVTLLGPGWTSMIPLVIRMLEYRGEHGQLLDKVSAEAKWLSDWAKDSAPSHHQPTQSTVESAIRVRYAQLKARSNGQI